MVISASTSSPAALNQHHLQHYQIMLRNGENVRKSPPSKKTKKTNLDFPCDSPSYRCIDLWQEFALMYITIWDFWLPMIIQWGYKIFWAAWHAWNSVCQIRAIISWPFVHCLESPLWRREATVVETLWLTSSLFLVSKWHCKLTLIAKKNIKVYTNKCTNKCYICFNNECNFFNVHQICWKIMETMVSLVLETKSSGKTLTSAIILRSTHILLFGAFKDKWTSSWHCFADKSDRFSLFGTRMKSINQTAMCFVQFREIKMIGCCSSI